MKKIIVTTLCTALASVCMLPTAAQAATVGSPFNVTVNLTAVCAVNVAAAPLNFGTYTAFGTASTPAPTTAVTFRCTQGFSPTAVQFDAVPALSTASAAGATATGTGIIAGLRYTLAVAAPTSVTGSAATAAAGSGADIKTYTVTGGMVAGQAGLVPAGAVTQARTLTITY